MENPEKEPSHRTMKTNYLCIPKFRTTTACARNNHRHLSPAMSLLDRLREAVFRLIMWSALSKATQESNPSSGARDHYRSCYDYVHDPRHSDAVAECIEFIKKSANADESRDSSEGVLPVRVM
ncbi:hypothetical protein Acr_05g0016430 [Actinidia rufa]|uniref:Uncharacterized protein n=1 Tax=Actinidia rufa TaxID=165716 RepID=A0A7J0ENE6_9ERIC|nr:hypothetical protein Acr_05g0016430 [Actinidia rufa]